MIGAVLAKRAGRQAFAALNRKDLDGIVGAFRDDGVFEFPGHSALAGRFAGKQAVREWFARWFAEMAEIHFTLKHVSVEHIFALGASNTVHVEWELDETNSAGQRFHVTGMTSLTARGGKAVLVHDYIPDQDVLEQAWPPARATA